MHSDTPAGSGNCPRRSWIFLTNHAHVLLEVSRTPDATVREIADKVGITERAAHRILADLVAEAYVTRERVGRRNHYSVDLKRRLRHPEDADVEVGALLSVFIQH
jgi:DNA-binding MarR family transcriptional regulator